MRRWPPDLAREALAVPAQAAHWPAHRWTGLVQQARRAGLLARIADQLQAALPQGPWPAGVNGHFAAATRLCAAQQAEVRREVDFIARALAGLDAPVVLLKGAAYLMAGLPAASGRIFGDIDIMVPKPALAETESRLTLAGWLSTDQSAYDQHYYRQWMHELPPMQHMHRGTVLDVHHAILPQTARLKPEAALLFAAAQPLAHHPGLHVLSPPDMVLHSMTHLFMNDEMSHALRDLSDLDLLLRHFGADADFWPKILQRAQALDLQRLLYYGLRHTSGLLGTPVPPRVMQAAADFAPRGGLGWLMDSLWLRALRSPHDSADAPLSEAARLALYLRGHWLRMPPWMLARHLGVKAGQAMKNKPSAQAKAP
jgi:hypothetical protein